MRGDRRQGESLLEPANRRRLAVSVDRRHLCEAARERGASCRSPSLWRSASTATARREVLGMSIGPSEAETFWTEFLRQFARRGLRGVKLVISDHSPGHDPAISDGAMISRPGMRFACASKCSQTHVKSDGSRGRKAHDCENLEARV